MGDEDLDNALAASEKNKDTVMQSALHYCILVLFTGSQSIIQILVSHCGKQDVYKRQGQAPPRGGWISRRWY